MARVTDGAAQVAERAQTLASSLAAARTARVRRDVWARVVEHADVLLQAADRLQNPLCLFTDTSTRKHISTHTRVFTHTNGCCTQTMCGQH